MMDAARYCDSQLVWFRTAGIFTVIMKKHEAAKIWLMVRGLPFGNLREGR
jgi:hypothetical protein